MDIAIKTIVHLSCFLVLLELLWRLFLSFHSEQLKSIITRGGYDKTWSFSGASFVICFLLCILIDFSGFKETEFSKSPTFRNFLTFLHASDGIAALIIGLSIYYRNMYGFTVGQLIISKFCLLALLNRMILAQKRGKDAKEMFTQTTKSYLHHVASFLFLAHPDEILLTTAWRTISMFGHAVFALRGRVEPETLHHFNWTLAYLRNAYMIFLVILGIISPTIRLHFAYSAIGHIAYLAVRLGPVFRLGSIYIEEEEKENWGKLSDAERLKTLFSGKYLWLSLELVLLASIIVILGSLRLNLFFSECHEALRLSFNVSTSSPL